MSIPTLLLFLTVIVLSDSQETSYRQIFHNSDPNAVCLDGSPSFLYLHSGSDTKNFIIFFTGGDMCGGSALSYTLEKCYNYTNSKNGSSQYWPKEYQPEGLMTTDHNLSQFVNWTKIIFPYCDGAYHQGNAEQPLKYKDKNLYFRGSKIIRSHFKWLLSNFSIDTAINVVLSGTSAGGIASLQWSNYFKSLLKNPNIVSVVADSAVYQDGTTYNPHFPLAKMLISNLIKVSNINEQSPVSECNSAYDPSVNYHCFFFENFNKFLSGRILIINSQYDSYSIETFSLINCLRPRLAGGSTLLYCDSEEQDFIRGGSEGLNSIVKSFQNLKKGNAWTIACSVHSILDDHRIYNSNQWKVPMDRGTTARETVESFILKNNTIAMQDVSRWPGNTPCS